MARRVRVLVGVILLFVFLTYTSETHTVGDETRSESRLGLCCSPWLTWTETVRATKTAAEGGGSIESRSTESYAKLTTASWSWPVLGAALVLLFWRRRKAPAESVVAPKAAPPNNPRP
jgi:hypothetical protein